MAVWLFCYQLIIRFETAYALSARVMTHAIGVQWAILAHAKANLRKLFATALKAFCSDRFEW